jgi:hypothetical protein
MSNVLSQEKKQQVIALGRLGWTLRKIEQTTGVRRETASRYLKEAEVAIRPPRRWGRGAPSSRAPDSKPANEAEVITDSGGALATPRPSGRSPTASTCEAYREAVELGLSRDRNAMAIYQDLVDSYGFTVSIL